MKIGILHPGEMGASVAATLKSGGNEVLWASTGRSPATRARAEQLGLTDAGSLENLCRECPAIVSVCPPEFADSVANQVLASGFKGAFLDLNAISPDRVQRMQARMAAAGVTLIDGGIIGIATMKPGNTVIYLSGEGAREAAGYFGPGPLVAEVMDGPVGQASALKMCFAGFSKGTSALLCAVLGAAEQLGVRDTLERQWQRNGSPNPTATLPTVARKAWRFAPEMHEIAATLASAGIPPEFHQAAAEIFSRMSGFKDNKPDYGEIVRALAPAAISETK